MLVLIKTLTFLCKLLAHLKKSIYLNERENLTIENIVKIRRAKLGQIQGGLQRASQDLSKGGGGGGFAIIFYFLRVKNITF